MAEEVRHLLETGLSPESLAYYGLEYRYIVLYLTGQLEYNPMESPYSMRLSISSQNTTNLVPQNGTGRMYYPLARRRNRITWGECNTCIGNAGQMKPEVRLHQCPGMRETKIGKVNEIDQVNNGRQKVVDSIPFPFNLPPEHNPNIRRTVYVIKKIK